MTMLSGKTMVMWLAAIFGWLAFSAALSRFGISASLLLLLNIAVTAVILVMIACKTTVREAQAFLAPFREGPSILTPPSVAVEWISGLGTVGTVVLMLMIGIDGFALVVGMVGGLVLSGGLIAPALAASGARTLPDWVAWRYGAKARMAAVLLFAVFGVMVIWVQFSFAAMLMEVAFGIPGFAGVLVVAILVLLCVLAGGMVTMVPAQAVLFVVLCTGVLVSAIWLGGLETGIVLPWLAPGALLHEIGVAEARLDISDGFVTHDPLRATMLGMTGLLGTMAMPHTLMRWPMERGAAIARYFTQRTVVMVVVVVAALPLFAIAARAVALVPALATLTTPDVLDTPAAAITAMMRILDPPGWLHAALGMAGLAAIVASTCGAALLATCGLVEDMGRETAGGMLMRLRWGITITISFAALLAMTVTVEPVTAFLALMMLAGSVLLAPLILGLFWPRATATGALAGIIIGGAVSIASLILGGYSLFSGTILLGVGTSMVSMVLVSLMGAFDPVLPVPSKKS